MPSWLNVMGGRVTHPSLIYIRGGRVILNEPALVIAGAFSHGRRLNGGFFGQALLQL
jgi:hypothetical protein